MGGSAGDTEGWAQRPLFTSDRNEQHEVTLARGDAVTAKGYFAEADRQREVSIAAKEREITDAYHRTLDAVEAAQEEFQQAHMALRRFYRKHPERKPQP